MKFPFFFSKLCVSEVELNDYHKFSTLNLSDATENFYFSLRKALASYNNRIFSASSVSSKTLLKVLNRCLSNQEPNFALILGMMTKFLSSKNMLLEPGELYQRLLPLWHAGMRLLCFNDTALEKFIEICDSENRKLLSRCVYTQLNATGQLYQIKVGEYLMSVAENYHQEYAQCLLMNRGIYPKRSENLPERFVSIDESFFAVRDSLELYHRDSTTSGVSTGYCA